MKRKSLGNSFNYAWEGLLYTVLTQRNMKIHFGITVLVVIAGFILGLTGDEWVTLILIIGFVLAAETFNTAVESLVDLVTTDHHPLAARAKNVAAGAVLISAISAVIAGLIIFGRHLF